MRAMFRVLGFFGMIRCIIFAPYCNFMYRQYEKKHRQIAESMGLTFEEYRESRMIYRRNGQIVTDEAERAAISKKLRKEKEAKERACQIEIIKEKYRLRDI